MAHDKNNLKQMPQISLSELREKIDDVFDHIQNVLKVSNIPLSEDYYWDFSKTIQLYDPKKKPDDLSVGSLVDNLQSLSTKDSVPPILMHIWPLLRYLADYEDWYSRNKKN